VGPFIPAKTCEIESARFGDATVLAINAPPFNFLSGRALDDLSSAIQEGLTSPSASIILIRGMGICFSGGLLPAEREDPSRVFEALTTVLVGIEAADKPVVAAVHGAVVGIGLELALACHYRFSSPETVFGASIASGGRLQAGTQRLARAVGVGPALDLILGSKLISADVAAEIGLVDQIGLS
jgi:3-hydroxyacyl-CoA dehydrogenase